MWYAVRWKRKPPTTDRRERQTFIFSAMKRYRKFSTLRAIAGASQVTATLFGCIVGWSFGILFAVALIGLLDAIINHIVN